MLTKVSEYRNIDFFCLTNSFRLAAIGNKVVELGNKLSQVELDHPVLRIVANDESIYATDYKGNSKRITENQISDFPYDVVEILPNGNCVAHLKQPKRTALLNAAGAILWELDFRSLEFLFTKEIIIFRDRREGDKVVAVLLESGKILWNKSLAELNHGMEFGTFVGIDGREVIFQSRKPEHIIFLDSRRGDLIRVIKGELLGNNQLGLEHFELDQEKQRLVKPGAEIDLKNLQVIPVTLGVFESLGRFGSDYTFNFSFVFDERNVFFGIQKHIAPQTDEYRCVGELVIADRNTYEVVYTGLINERKEDADVKQMELFNGSLFVLDSFGNLTTYKVG